MECEGKIQENAQLKRSLANLKTDLDKARKELNDSTLEIDKLKFNAKTQSMRHQDEISKVNQTNRNLDQELKEKNSYIDRMKSNTERLNGENTKIRKLCDEQIKENTNLKEKNRKLKTLLNETSSSYGDTKNFKQKATELYKFGEDKMKVLFEENKKLKVEIQELQAANIKLNVNSTIICRIICSLYLKILK